MRKLMAVALVVMFLIPAVMSQALAAEKSAQEGIPDAGNKLCPVSGEPVSGTGFVVYQGKRYGLCCPMCEAAFLKDPEQYIVQMEAKEKVSSPATSADAAASEEMETAMEQGSL